jgi:hypothetical protein
MSGKTESADRNTDDTQKNTVDELRRVFTEFLSDLETLYPEKKEIGAFKGEVEGDGMRALRHIISAFLPHMDEISRRDHAACIALGEQLELIPGFSFQACWQGEGEKAEEISQASQEALWKYLHTFYYLTCSYDKLDDVIQEFATQQDIFKGIIRSLQNHSKISQQIIASGMFRAPSGSGSVPGGSGGMPEGFPFSENSQIGQLAREIASEVDFNAFQDIKSPADLFQGMFGGASGGQAGNGGIGKLISTVGEKLSQRLNSGNLNEAGIFQEAQQMMGMMSPMMTQMMGSAFFPPGMGGGKKGGSGQQQSPMPNPFDLMSMMMGGMNMGGGQPNEEKKKKKRNKKKK